MNNTFSQDNTAASPLADQTPPKTFPLRLFQTFNSPHLAFSGGFRRWQWAIAVVITGLLGIMTQSLQGPYLAPDMKKGALSTLEQARDQLSTEQYEEMRQKIVDGIDREFKISPLNTLTELASAALFALCIALACSVSGNFFLGGKALFWQVLTVVAFAGFIGLAGDIARTALMVAKGSSHVSIGLGVLKGTPDNSFLFYFLRQMEFFSMWRIAVTCIGLGALYSKPALHFAMALAPLWLLFIALVAMLNGLTGGTIIY